MDALDTLEDQPRIGPQIEPGKRYILRWQAHSATAGTTEPQERTVDVHRVENGYVHGYVGQARLDYLPLSRVLSAVPA